MALVRCKSCGQPSGRSKIYVKAVEPLGYPDTAAICGLNGCHKPGLIWLDESDSAEYDKGQRVFFGQTSVMKAKAK